MRRFLWLLVVLALLLTACAGDDDNDSTTDEPAGQLGLFDWRRDADSIVVRVDSQLGADDPALMLNNIPPCTLWGDGRLVWTTFNEYGEEVVLEARLDDTQVRQFLEDIIARGFYDWEDELLPPTSFDLVLESITVSLYDEVSTVRRYSNWPQNGYATILETCRTLSATPVMVRPESGWISAYEVPFDNEAPNWTWPPSAPFTLKELAESGEARWLEGSLATQSWQAAREGYGDMQTQERGGTAYHIAIVVPGYSRDALPPPEESES